MCSSFRKFNQSVQVASSDEGFASTSTDAVYHYHSVYDSQRWQEAYADVGFYRHASHGVIIPAPYI